MNISEALARSGGVDWARKIAGKKVDGSAERSSQAKASDSVSISTNARKLSSTGEAQVRSRVEALPEVREERVQQVRERLEQGYYNTPAFHEQLAEKLVKTNFGA